MTFQSGNPETGQWHVSAWPRAPLCLEIGAPEYSSVWESFSPRVCVWAVRQPHCRNTGALPHNYVRRQKASKLFCLLGIWRREKNLLFANPRRKQKPSECGCGYYLGVLRVTFILQIEPNKGKKSDVNAARDIGIHCLLCSRCVFCSSPTRIT